MNAMTIFLGRILHSQCARKIVTTRWVPTVAAAIVDTDCHMMEERALVIQKFNIFNDILNMISISCIPS